MTTQQQQNYRNYTRTDTPLDKLMRGFKTVGDIGAKSMNLEQLSTYMVRGREMIRFNVRDEGQKLELHPGLVWMDDVFGYSNKSSGKDKDEHEWTRYYGAFTGLAHVDPTDGHYTLRSSMPAITLPDRKVNVGQRNAFTDAVGNLCSKHGKLLSNGLEINPTSITLFESREQSAEGIPAFRLLVIEAAGIFGVDSKGRSIYCSIKDFPIVSAAASQGEEGVQDKPAPRSRARRTSVAQDAPADNGVSADVGGELVTA